MTDLRMIYSHETGRMIALGPKENIDKFALQLFKQESRLLEQALSQQAARKLLGFD